MDRQRLARRLAKAWLVKHRQYRQQYDWQLVAGEYALAHEADECAEAASITYQALMRMGDNVEPWVRQLEANKATVKTAHARTVYSWGIESLMRLGED